jgi:hypothetical protein
MGITASDLRSSLALKPRRGRRKDHAANGKSDAELRMRVVEMAADMEMGYYQTEDGRQQEPHAFIIKELLRRTGYEGGHIDQGWRPSWWPGTDELRRMVSLKMLLRQAQRTPREGDLPWMDAALAASAEEILRRLYIDPAGMGLRELVDLTTKLARMKAERPAPSDDGKPKRGTMVFEEIRRTILELPESERGRAAIDMERAIERARAAVPAIAAVVTPLASLPA